MNEEIEHRFLESAEVLGAKSPRIEVSEDEYDEIAGAASERFSLWAETESGGEDELAWGMISSFPNCCGIAVFGDAGASDLKFLKWIFQLREAIAKSDSRGLAVQTHHARNPEMLKVMRQLRWRAVCPNWLNPNSGNRVTMWLKVLR